ncbi:MAG: hypothetical protein AAFR74_00115 [Pseudomonadota bacterium]
MTILFCLHAVQKTNPERIAFLEAAQQTLGRDLRLAVFNESSTAESNILTVVNASDRGGKPGRAGAAERLKAKLKAEFGGRANWWLKEATDEGFLKFGDRDRAAQVFERKFNAFLSTMDEFQPSHVYLWNAFNSFHRVLRGWLEAKGIPTAFFHDGVIPGSLAFDFDGEMGESWVAREPQRLLDVPVSEAEMAKARAHLTWLIENNINRHPQKPGVDLEFALEEAGDLDKPLIVYAGQNDWHAGISPDGPRRPLHSPLYKSSFEAVADLDKAAGEMGAFVLYKPHPNDRDPYLFLRGGKFKNTLILQACDLNECLERAAVIVTIASQTCYVAAMRGKPVVMLGRNQFSGKGMGVDVSDRATLRAGLERAIQDHDAEQQFEAFARHLAQLDKTYLYDFQTLDDEYFQYKPSAFAEVLRAQAGGASASELIDMRLNAHTQSAAQAA